MDDGRVLVTDCPQHRAGRERRIDEHTAYSGGERRQRALEAESVRDRDDLQGRLARREFEQPAELACRADCAFVLHECSLRFSGRSRCVENRADFCAERLRPFTRVTGELVVDFSRRCDQHARAQGGQLRRQTPEQVRKRVAPVRIDGHDRTRFRIGQDRCELVFAQAGAQRDDDRAYVPGRQHPDDDRGHVRCDHRDALAHEAAAAEVLEARGESFRSTCDVAEGQRAVGPGKRRPRRMLCEAFAEQRADAGRKPGLGH